MLDQLASILLPILISVAIGYAWGWRGLPFDTELVTRLVWYVGAPCLVISSFLRVGFDLPTLMRMGGAALTVTALVASGAMVLIRILGVDWRAYLPCMIFPNSGNMGLPICLFAFGETGLALGVAWFMVISVLHFTLGVAMFSGEARWSELLRSPLCLSILLALVLVVFPFRPPVWMGNTVDLLGGMTIPLMLLALGYSLSQIRVTHWRTGILFAVGRSGVGLAAGLLAIAVFDLQGAERGVVLLQASMPVAVFNYLFAAQFHREAEAVGTLVVLSTILASLALPFVLVFAGI